MPTAEQQEFARENPDPIVYAINHQRPLTGWRGLVASIRGERPKAPSAEARRNVPGEEEAPCRSI